MKELKLSFANTSNWSQSCTRLLKGELVASFQAYSDYIKVETP